MNKISVDDFINILSESDYPVLFIGSGYDYTIGYKYYSDYKSDNKVDLDNLFLSCKELNRSILDNYNVIIDLLEQNIFKTILTTSPFCLYRCCDNIDVVKDRIIPIMGCIDCVDCLINKFPKLTLVGKKLDHRLFIKALTEIMISDLLIISGFNPILSPLNLLPLLIHYGRGKMVLVETNYNPYMGVADYWLQLSLSKTIHIINERLRKNKLVS